MESVLNSRIRVFGKAPVRTHETTGSRYRRIGLASFPSTKAM
jgi:hypothetical protein